MYESTRVDVKKIVTIFPWFNKACLKKNSKHNILDYCKIGIPISERQFLVVRIITCALFHRIHLIVKYRYSPFYSIDCLTLLSFTS